MKKIVLLPLDERPCNYLYPSLIASKKINLVTPNKNILGDKKVPGDVDKISEWLIKESNDADAIIVSMDMLLFGGIVPSRLHFTSVDELIRRSEVIRKIRSNNKKAKIYLFELIMRCPSYSSNDEEPDYYNEYGEMIFSYGRLSHLESLNLLTEEDKKTFENIKNKLPKEFLNDYVSRRSVNTNVLIHNLELLKDNTVDYFIVPQDDASEYGFTSLDQKKVRTYLKDNYLHTKSAMYPSADDTGLILLARAVSELNKKQSKIFVKYISNEAPFVVPWFEDRALDETIKYHILASNSLRVYSLNEADIVLTITMGSKMVHFSDPEFNKHYIINRNINEMVAFINYSLEKGKIVAIGDNATCNGSDELIFNALYENDLLFKIHSYAGWNTSSNTLGTTICQAIMYLIYKEEKKNKEFLTYRYFEDMGYMCKIRSKVTNEILPKYGLNYFQLDGKEGTASKEITKELFTFMKDTYPKVCDNVKVIETRQPWNRMFETEIHITFKE